MPKATKAKVSARRPRPKADRTSFNFGANVRRRGSRQGGGS